MQSTLDTLEVILILRWGYSPCWSSLLRWGREDYLNTCTKYQQRLSVAKLSNIWSLVWICYEPDSDIKRPANGDQSWCTNSCEDYCWSLSKSCKQLLPVPLYATDKAIERCIHFHSISSLRMMLWLLSALYAVGVSLSSYGEFPRVEEMCSLACTL